MRKSTFYPFFDFNLQLSPSSHYAIFKTITPSVSSPLVQHKKYAVVPTVIPCFASLKYNMKFAVGVTTALVAIGTASAFAPQSFAAKSCSSLSIATEPVYTFTKSEEIFAEAQEVRQLFVRLGK
jgi:hypothetical protein